MSELVFHSEAELLEYLRTVPEGVSITITVEMAKPKETADGEERGEKTE